MTEPSAQYDLLVIGGGVNGAGIARDAAGRGLAVCLVEQDDLAAHTSSASTKLIHGGLRYLEQGELRLVREALAERERLLAIAPHIVRPLRFVLPYIDGLRPRWLLRLGLFVYDHAGGREKLAASAGTRLAGTPLGAPLRADISDGFEYSDCAVDDSRLVVLNALDAAERGATVLTRRRVVAIEAQSAGWQITVEDRGNGARAALRARALVNATGAWVNGLLQLAGLQPRQHLRLVKGSHLVLRRQYEGEHAYLLQSPDRRVVFAIPWEGCYTLVGTTDVPFDGDPARVSIDAAETGYLLGILNRFLRRPATAADIVASFSGVRPLYDDGSGGTAQQVSRDYHLELQHNATAAPILSVYGGKITTYRRLAEHALALLLPAMDIHGTATWTGGEPLPGGDLPAADYDAFLRHSLARWPEMPPDLIARLARHYGTRMARILGDARRLEDLGARFGTDLTLAEVRHLVAGEWARGAEDILWRRTRLGIGLPASAVHDLQDAVAQLLG
ncbi:MAG TPA: glycerol-3-phosphate dehydrogenase [Steroidobacteraceae bacterium]|nr:glycerol-3-phosphate dehydrogenase [Steroidobacteraceae bacterium]